MPLPFLKASAPVNFSRKSKGKKLEGTESFNGF